MLPLNLHGWITWSKTATPSNPSGIKQSTPVQSSRSHNALSRNFTSGFSRKKCRLKETNSFFCLVSSKHTWKLWNFLITKQDFYSQLQGVYHLLYEPGSEAFFFQKCKKNSFCVWNKMNDDCKSQYKIIDWINRKYKMTFGIDNNQRSTIKFEIE